VVEGPSGIGKTSAIKRALDLISTDEQWRATSLITLLSARNPTDIERVLNLPSWHRGTVVIDDAHRLPDRGFSVAVDQMKLLADTDDVDRRLILVGIPLTSQSLVDVSFDLATRIDTYRLGRVTDDLVLEMISRGEQALNVTFDRKADIVRAAAGSLNVAQAICFSVAAISHILQTQTAPVVLDSDIERAVAEVLEGLALKFDPAIRAFARLGGPDNRTCVELLEHLARSNEGYLSIHDPNMLSPSLRQRAKRLLTAEALTIVADECPDWHRHFYYDPRSRALVIEDPQLGFYLQQISISRVLRQAGKVDNSPRRIVFISYAHADEPHLDRLRIHLGPVSRRVGVELWDDTRIEPGRRWREELDDAVDSAIAAVLLVSADYLASEFVQQEELPRLTAAADYGSLRLLPILVGPCVLDGHSLDKVQFVNSRSHPISTATTAHQDAVWANVAKTIATLLT
jgi:TIR domain